MTPEKKAVIILAAGASSRMGRPKQLLPYQGRSLLEHACNVAMESVADQVVVVLGANATAIAPPIADLRVVVALNPDWEQGMASSIRCGLSAVLDAVPDIAAVTIMLADQPLLTAEQLNSLQAQHRASGKGIVASAYAGSLGTPALFTKKYFSQLLELTGAEGAKKLLHRYPDDVQAIPFPGGALDIDTPEDYANLFRTNS